MSELVAVLLLGPPAVGLVTWMVTRAWTRIAQGEHPTQRTLAWQRYDVWVIITVYYVLAIGTAIIEGKL